MINQALLDDLWNGEKAIAFFVHSGKCYWLIDCKYNFTLDAEKDCRAYLEKGHITRDQYEMHMDVGRYHEELAYSDWYTKVGDFLFLIPDSERYWTVHGDAWKLRFV